MYSNILDILTSNNIRTALLRDRLNEIDSKSELDVLIDPMNINLTLKLLADQGWVVYRRDRINSHKFVAVKVVSGRRSYVLDIHTALVQNALVYLDNDWYFSHCIVEPNNLYLYQPEVEAYIYHIIFHVILGKVSLSTKYFSRLSSIKLDSLKQQELRSVAQQYGLENILSKVLVNPVSLLSDKTQVMSFNYEAKKNLILKDPMYFLRVGKSFYYRTIGKLFGLNRGFTVAFIGPDGAGKSTFIDKLEHRLNELGLKASNAYMGPWFRNKLFTTLMLESIGAHPKDEILGLKDIKEPLPKLYKKAKGLIKRYLYYLNCPLEVYFRYFRYVFLQSIQGRVVLIDRYIHDLEVGYKNKEVINSERLRKLIVRISPTPDAVVLLYNDPETIWQRKKDYELEEICWSMGRYMSLADIYGFEKVLTDKDSEVLVDRFIEKHWKEIYSRKSD